MNSEFKLSEAFIEQYKGKQPDWGPIGSVIFQRTYSRPILEENRTEEWWETLRRVVEGTYSTQRKYCKNLNVYWHGVKAQTSGQEMYRLMWDMKFLPPGRGLWMMGTECIEKKLAAPLYNCSAVTSANLNKNFSEPFCFLMDMSMLGVGVGSDTRGAGTVTIRKPRQGNYTLTVEDSREGWIELIRTTLDAYVGKGSLPVEVDYSKVRPYGAPIRTFGGTASGSLPLEQLYQDIQDILNPLVGSAITSRAIVDLFNAIARCVVSGNVRRSATIMLGNPDDDEFLALKDRKTNAERLDKWAWASNNSVFATIGMDYSSLVNRTANNGEPGYFWLENARCYDRMCDPLHTPDEKIVATNPCFAADTLIAVADGRGAVPIQKLAAQEKDVPVYSLDPDTGKVAIKWGRHPRLSGVNSQMIRVTLDDGSHLDVTPDHKFPLLNGSIKKAQALEPGDSFHRFDRRPEKMNKHSSSYYLRVHINTLDTQKDKIFEHRLITQFHDTLTWESKYKQGKANGWISGGLVIHHRNYNSLDNRPDNLEILTFREHTKLHANQDTQGEKNGRFSGYSNKNIEQAALELTKTLKRRFSTEEWKDYASPLNIPLNFSQWRQRDKWFRSVHELSLWAATKLGYKYNSLDPRIVRHYQELLTQGYQAVIKNKKVWVIKKCEGCGRNFDIHANRREQCYCSIKCSTQHSDKSKSYEGIRLFYIKKQEFTLKKQRYIYKSLKKNLGRKPLKTEWIAKCKSQKVSYRIASKAAYHNNPYALRSYADLEELPNHSVISIKRIENKKTYTITVDDYHTVGIITTDNRNTGRSSGIFTFQCGEISLEDMEACNVPETFPARHDTLEEYLRTLKFAYLYAKTVTLIPTHNMRVNAVQLKNRKIGLSMSGIAQSFKKHGVREHYRWCDEGYKYLKHMDEVYSDWLCIPRSKALTSVKPSGTVSLLPGATSGIHFPISEFYWRVIRMDAKSKMVQKFKKASYRVEKAEGHNTVAVYFPVQEKDFYRSASNVSMWEQLEIAAQMQHWWADNQVSVTIRFKEEEKSQIKQALELYETRLKSVSFYPLELREKYKHPPLQPMTKKEYKEAIKKLKPVKLSNVMETEGFAHTYCDSDHCELT